jgi:hypothetical protein
VDEPHELQHLADLVPLEVADHVPPQLVGKADVPGAVQLAVPLEELVDLAHPLHEGLHAVLGEVRVAQLDQLADLIDRGKLRHRRQHDVLGAAAAADGGVPNSPADGLVALLECRVACHCLALMRGDGHGGGG